MSLVVWGGLLGAGTGVGAALVADRLTRRRRPRLETRVLPYVRDLPVGVARAARTTSTGTTAAEHGSVVLRAIAARLDRLLGGRASVRRRLQRANLPLTVEEFRVEQVVWGLIAFAVAAVPALLFSMGRPGNALPLLVTCLTAFAVGTLLRENRLTAQVRQRERRMIAEFPAVAELFALAVAAGEGPVPALHRVVSRSSGELSVELARVLSSVRAGTPVIEALDDLATSTGLPVVARFAEALAVSLERGTPLSAVMHAQAADVREAGRRALIETGARREVLMMVPVVFLVLPVTVLFAFWPGVVGLHLVVP